MRELNFSEVENVSGGIGNGAAASIPWMLDGNSSSSDPTLRLGTVTVTPVLSPLGAIGIGAGLGALWGFGASMYDQMTDGVPGINGPEVLTDTMIGATTGALAGAGGLLGGFAATNGAGAGAGTVGAVVGGSFGAFLGGTMGDAADEQTQFFQPGQPQPGDAAS